MKTVPRAGMLGALCALSLAGCAAPPAPFSTSTAPPAPDYERPETWLALGGSNGLEQSAPAGLPVMAQGETAADVFFIHPTTATTKAAWNAPWNLSNDEAPLNASVLLGQASVFNGCCRIFVPRYRQATLPALSQSQPAVDLAYGDVARAFRQFIAGRSEGRPFIIASHSQGTAHAIRLLQEEVLGGRLEDRLVVAYLIGGYVPDTFPEIGLPICDAPARTRCVVSWNAAKRRSPLARLVIDDKTYWWRGEQRDENQPAAVCVNPLTWRPQGDADTGAEATANPGSMPLPTAPFPTASTVLPPLTPGVTGARCEDGLLEVQLADAPPAYGDGLSRIAGSYHLNDYGLFYAALRANASVRVRAHQAQANPDDRQTGRPG